MNPSMDKPNVAGLYTGAWRLLGLISKQRNTYAITKPSFRTALYLLTKAAGTKPQKLGSQDSQKCDLEATSLKPRCPQGWFLLRTVGRSLFHALLWASGSLWQYSGHRWPSSPCVSLSGLFSLSLSLSLSLSVCLYIKHDFKFFVFDALTSGALLALMDAPS
jgi:hypothetical protein